MIERLEAASGLFQITSTKLDSAVKPLSEKYGFTNEVLKKFYSEMKREAESY